MRRSPCRFGLGSTSRLSDQTPIAEVGAQALSLNDVCRWVVSVAFSCTPINESRLVCLPHDAGALLSNYAGCREPMNGPISAACRLITPAAVRCVMCNNAASQTRRFCHFFFSPPPDLCYFSRATRALPWHLQSRTSRLRCFLAGVLTTLASPTESKARRLQRKVTTSFWSWAWARPM